MGVAGCGWVQRHPAWQAGKGVYGPVAYGGGLVRRVKEDLACLSGVLLVQQARQGPQGRSQRARPRLLELPLLPEVASVAARATGGAGW